VSQETKLSLVGFKIMVTKVLLFVYFFLVVVKSESISEYAWVGVAE